VPDRSNVKSPVPVPVVLNNNVVGDIHYDENIVLFQEPSAFFHTVVEQFPKILELKKNNENFKVLLIQSRRSMQEKISTKVDHHVSSFFKDNGIDYIILHNDPENMHKTISIYDIPWVYNHKLGSAFRFDSLREYFKEIVKDPIPGKKIFLARNYHVYGRGWNNYELLYDYLHSKGFEIFYLENHSFNNQIKICSSAEYIISMVGSSLVVPMLATNNTKIISIHTSTMEEYGVYHWQSGRNDGIIKSIYLDEDSNDIINYLETSSNYLIREAIDL